LDYIHGLADEGSFVELHGDRNFGDDPAMVGGIASISGNTVMLIGTQKGRTTKERQHRRFGMSNPEGYRKALRLMKLAENSIFL
jgi:acetyl-CoA carboxylase carboxyl transferase subunit alpha